MKKIMSQAAAQALSFEAPFSRADARRKRELFCDVHSRQAIAGVA
jgi:hypothetical protein